MVLTSLVSGFVSLLGRCGSAQKWCSLFELDKLCSFKDLMWGLLMEANSSPERVAKAATCAWALWGNQNEVKLGGQCKSGLALVQKVVQFLEEYYAATSTATGASVPSIQQISWVPPQGL